MIKVFADVQKFNHQRLPLFRRYLNNENGNFSTFAAVGVFTLLLAIGVSTDLHVMHSKQQEVKNLIDNATLASALALQSGDESDAAGTPLYQKTGEEIFFHNGRFDSQSIKSLEFTISPGGDSVTGHVTLDHDLHFGGVLGGKSRLITAQTTVGFAGEQAGSGCIVILEDNGQGLNLNSGAHIDAPDCDVSIHSTSNPALSINGGVDLNVNKLCVAGEHITNNTGQEIPNLETGCDVMENPFEAQFPTPDLSCDYNHGNFNNAVITLNPGVYCGWFNFNNGNANVTFNPGTYVIKNGGWNVNGGHWEGDGVTFYYADQQSKLNFNSGVTGNIKAPSSGDYKGVAIFEPDGLSESHLNLNDSTGFYITGLVYLPSRNLTFNSGSDLTVRETGFIVNKLTMNSGTLVLGATTILAGAGGNGSGGSSSGGSVSTPYLTE